MHRLNNKRILLGICGSIAAYKSAELVRRFRDQGAEVRVVMSQAATEFITPLTLQSLSGHPVRTELMDPMSEVAMGHIELARWADAFVIAPATQDLLARLVQGRADDLMTALYSVTQGPVAVVPAMNHSMWLHEPTQNNVSQLREAGVRIFEPQEGEQACGETGPGRMMEPDQIVQATADLFETKLLQGLSILVTAGPTREAIDPVRYISNRSSGKMGFAIAQACAEAGANVTLVAGPVNQETPDRVRRIDIVSTQQMHDVVNEHCKQADIFISSAAVADYRPATPAEKKIKKSPDAMTIELEATPDILKTVSVQHDQLFTVGFAAETDKLEQAALTKLANKKLDMICANWVNEGQGFDRDDNALEVYWEDGHKSLPNNTKTRLARQLVQLVAERYYAKHTIKNSG
jgi:phosphopantothenoylcysteine decarboxylase/phosphopantothenate--cysteine ligase